ncbi:aldo/keto reductase [Peptoclostridium sp. AF21-18]|uniref:aldo/keto reductase n=1 Tax=Peptoclostridium sp. AF21-18 TaxID=2292243 RepID=UPI000E485035|nr:aldo/keto reductase [Peptoclostridium sp. AF21-18]RHQ97745.1 aldo/keto reductase [Peptoclostridium sp. AF21-18]
MKKEYTVLSNGVKMPNLAFGTFKVNEGDDVQIILDAINVGYRHFDTAAFYNTEEALGKAIKKSGIPREEFFITTKVWKTCMGYEGAKKSFEESLEKLDMDYVDLLLIHWPRPDEKSDWKKLDIETWKAFEEIYKEGRAKAIGVSNFLNHHMQNILDNCEVVPMVNQIEFHPGYIQKDVVDFDKEHGIVVEAWSPLGRERVFKDELLNKLAQKYGKSVAQICLAFALQMDVVPLPKSSSAERMKQNMDIDFELEKEDFEKIVNMEEMGWSGLDPDKFQ